jgi:hypothetical protein
MTTNVPAIQFTPTGVVIPSELNILGGVLADMNQAFGGDMNLDVTTPQGQLAQSQTAIIGDKNDQIAYVVNQLNPYYSSGVFQDAIASIYFLNRNPAQSTVVQCLCTGANGTVIPVNAQVKDAAGNIYLCINGGTIPAGGSITLSFANQVAGAIPCPANTLTTIYQTIVGWDTINNAAAGTIGNEVESQADFEFRRSQSVAANGKDSLSAIYGAVFGVAGVIDVYAIENVADTAVNVGATNYPMKAHSIYVAVVGGIAADIAKQIWIKKSAGCAMNGNMSVIISDNNYSYPPPTYTILYNIPTSTPILFAIQIANNSTLPGNIITLVQNAIIAAVSGSDGGSRARIGGTLLASRYYAPVTNVSLTGINIISLFIGITSPTLNSIQLGIDQAPTVSASNISVTLV